MKVAIYGVSRSGKNYLLEKLVSMLNVNNVKRACHLEGSTTLNDLAVEQFGKRFAQLCEEQKVILRKSFTKIIHAMEEKFEVVFVDGHYSFIDGDDYKVVFTEDDKISYDTFFYLDTPSEMIVEFSRHSEGSKRNLSITEEQVRNWKSFEKSELSNVCTELEKELIILDEDTATCLSFIEVYVADREGEKFNPVKVAGAMVDSFSESISGYSTIVLLDCDKTISENDMTYSFCRELGVKSQELKQVFRNDRYTVYQFYKVAKIYSSRFEAQIENAATKAKSDMKLNPYILDNLNKLEGSFKLGITSGVYSIWRKIKHEHLILDGLIGCRELHKQTWLVTPSVKREVSKQLKEMGKTVVAVGDSIIDIPMLESADRGYIVAHEKINKATMEYFEQTPNSKICQVSYSQHKYDNVTIKGKIR